MELKKTLTMPKGTFPMRANLPSWEGNMVSFLSSKTGIFSFIYLPPNIALIIYF